MFHLSPEAAFFSLLSQNEPQAAAKILGSHEHPELSGYARFFETPYAGILLEVEVYGLPDKGQGDRSDTPDLPHFYGMHIHEHGDCTPPFDQTGSHFNPGGLPHPQHTGDLPPLMSSNGYAFAICYDALLSIEEIENRSLVIHARPDDFATQPSGNSGDKIGCGMIQRIFHEAPRPLLSQLR